MTNEDAIKWLENLKQDIGQLRHEDLWHYEQAIYEIIALLKEQDAENGKWITIWREDDPDTSTHARCSICNRISERPLGGYCKWCGAKMNQEWGVDG